MHFPFPRHDRTPHVRFDPRACASCGACVDACTRGVLSLLPYRLHHHAHVDHPERCKGCLRCVDACEARAIRAAPEPPSSTPNSERSVVQARAERGAEAGDSEYHITIP